MGAYPLAAPQHPPTNKIAAPSTPGAAKNPKAGAANWSEVDGAGAQIADSGIMTATRCGLILRKKRPTRIRNF